MAAFAIYATLAQLAYWPILPGTSSRVATCACADASFQSWLLGWIPFAIGHLHNPFFSSWANYPLGVNLAQNTNMTLLGLLVSPITLTAGPIASYNLLLLLSFPLSAISMYWVTREWTRSRLAAFAAGLLYGFSAYMVAQGRWHIMLIFVPLPPLFFYQLHKLVTRHDERPYVCGAMLGLIASAQLFIEPEILVSMILFGMMALILYVLAMFRSITRGQVSNILRGLLLAGGIVAVMAAYPLWFALRGTQHFADPAWPFDNQWHGVILGAIRPSIEYHTGLAILPKYAQQVDNAENGQYLGIPLILLVSLFVVWYRRNRALLMSVTLALIAYVLALGPRMTWLHGMGSTPLPFNLLRHIPLVNNLLPDRLSLYTGLFLGVAVAIGISELSKPISPAYVRGRYVHLPWEHRRRAQVVRRIGAAVIGISAIIALIPAWPYPSAPTKIPHFFVSSEVERIPANSVVLTYPLPVFPANQAMSWESASEMRFKEIEADALVGNADGRSTMYPAFLAPTSVESYLVGLQTQPEAYSPPEPQRQLVADVRRFASTWKLGAVIVDLDSSTVFNVPTALEFFTRAFGPPTNLGGVGLWLITKGDTTR